MSQFELHERLQQDCLFVTDLPLCRVLLMNESRYPWFILVPRKSNLTELMQLNENDARQYWFESGLMQQFLSFELNAEKLNVAALGNVVPQLHIHHVARFSDDAAWPAPVWGKFEPEPWGDNEAIELINQLKQFLELN